MSGKYSTRGSNGQNAGSRATCSNMYTRSRPAVQYRYLFWVKWVNGQLWHAKCRSEAYRCRNVSPTHATDALLSCRSSSKFCQPKRILRGRGVRWASGAQPNFERRGAPACQVLAAAAWLALRDAHRVHGKCRSSLRPTTQ